MFDIPENSFHEFHKPRRFEGDRFSWTPQHWANAQEKCQLAQQHWIQWWPMERRIQDWSCQVPGLIGWLDRPIRVMFWDKVESLLRGQGILSL
jgi:hypothetical protein